MVLSDWKKDLWDARPDWGRSLHSDEWWALVNHVIDHVTFPSADVWTGCHQSEPTVPLCWLAVRGVQLLHKHARISVSEHPELAARLERELTEHTACISAPFNPFMELKLSKATPAKVAA